MTLAKRPVILCSNSRRPESLRAGHDKCLSSSGVGLLCRDTPREACGVSPIEKPINTLPGATHTHTHTHTHTQGRVLEALCCEIPFHALYPCRFFLLDFFFSLPDKHFGNLPKSQHYTIPMGLAASQTWAGRLLLFLFFVGGVDCGVHTGRDGC